MSRKLHMAASQTVAQARSSRVPSAVAGLLGLRCVGDLAPFALHVCPAQRMPAWRQRSLHATAMRADEFPLSSAAQGKAT